MSNLLNSTNTSPTLADQIFTSEGGAKSYEIFTLSKPAVTSQIYIQPISGPSFANNPGYPSLRVVDFEFVGELIKVPGSLDVR